MASCRLSAVRELLLCQNQAGCHQEAVSMARCRLSAGRELLVLPGCRDSPASRIALQYKFMLCARCTCIC